MRHDNLRVSKRNAAVSRSQRRG